MTRGSIRCDAVRLGRRQPRVAIACGRSAAGPPRRRASAYATAGKHARSCDRVPQRGAGRPDAGRGRTAAGGGAAAASATIRRRSGAHGAAATLIADRRRRAGPRRHRCCCLAGRRPRREGGPTRRSRSNRSASTPSCCTPTSLAGLSDLDGALAELQKALRSRPEYRRPLEPRHVTRRPARAGGSRGGVPQSHCGGTAISARRTSRWPISSGSRGAWSMPRPCCKEAVAVEPTHGLALKAIGLFYVTTGRAAAAEPFLKRRADASKSPIPKLELASYYHRHRPA